MPRLWLISVLVALLLACSLSSSEARTSLQTHSPRSLILGSSSSSPSPPISLSSRRGGGQLGASSVDGIDSSTSLASSSPPPSLFFPVVVSFLYNLSVAIMTSTLPKLINSLSQTSSPSSSTPASRNGVTPEGVKLYSSLLATDQLFTLLAIPPLLTLSDKVGRKPLLLWSSLGLTIGWLTLLQSLRLATPSLPLLYLGRLIDGLSSIASPVTTAYVIDSTPDKNKLPNKLGVLQGVGVGMAFVLGAPIGGFLIGRPANAGPPSASSSSSPPPPSSSSLSSSNLLRLGLAKPVAVACAISFANLLFTAFLVPESSRGRMPQKSRESGHSPIGDSDRPSFLSLLLNPADRSFFQMLLLLTLVWASINTFQVTIFNVSMSQFAWPPYYTSLLQALNGVFLTTIPPLVHLITSRKSLSGKSDFARPAAVLTYRLGVVLLLLSSFSLFHSSTSKQFALSSVLFGLSSALTLPALTSCLLSHGSIPAASRGYVLGKVEGWNALNRAAVYYAVGQRFGKILADKAERPNKVYGVAGAAMAGAAAVVGWMEWSERKGRKGENARLGKLHDEFIIN